MPVYILRLPGSEFTGYMAGVDFFQGKGSTSSLQDAHRLAQLKNCGVSVLDDGTERPVVVKKTDQEHLAPVYAAAPVGLSEQVNTQAGGASAEAPSVTLSAAMAALKTAEDNPDSPGQKELAAKLRDKAKRGGRRRKT